MVFLSKSADLRIVVDTLEMLLPVPDCLTRWIRDPSLFQMLDKSGLHLVMDYDAINSVQEVA